MVQVEELNRLLTRGESAELLGVSYSRVSSLVACGELPSIRTPAGVLIDPEELEKYKERRSLRKLGRPSTNRLKRG